MIRPLSPDERAQLTARQLQAIDGLASGKPAKEVDASMGATAGMAWQHVAVAEARLGRLVLFRRAGAKRKSGSPKRERWMERTSRITPLDEKLAALGRCKCGLLNPCDCEGERRASPWSGTSNLGAAT